MLDSLVSLFMVLSVCTMFAWFGFIAKRGASDEEIMAARRMRGYAPEAMCTCGHDGTEHDWIAIDRSVCNGEPYPCTCPVFSGVIMNEQSHWNEFEMKLSNPLLSVLWTFQRQPISLDIDDPMKEPSLDSMASELTITLDPRVVESNPVITIVAGDRIFRVIENLPDGLFGEG
jgi:hypothetical protein